MLRKAINLLTPPLLARLYRKLRHLAEDGCGLSGDYSSWQDALDNVSGYHSATILEKTRTALLEVKEGRAAFERDTVLFHSPEYSWHLLASLMLVAAQCGGRLSVLDFGGSLGSAYFQHRPFLHSLNEVRWDVVEQQEHVRVGREWFEDQELRFYTGIEESLVHGPPNVVLLGSVLQYLERPHEVLGRLLSLPCNHVLIDRTPFWEGAADRLCVQKVPPAIYEGSYPCWVFARQPFMGALTIEWKVLAEFRNTDRLPAPVAIDWRGMLLVRLGGSRR